MNIIKLIRCCVWLLLLACSQPLHAALTIEIVGGGANQVPIAVAPFLAEDKLPQSITEVVRADLQRSGLFKLVDATGVTPPPSEPAEVVYPTWQARGADMLVIGSIIAKPDGNFEARFRLMDVTKQAQVLGLYYTLTPSQVRVTAHRIADDIYEKLTGDAGVFSTKIAYVLKEGERYELQVADADGYGAQAVLTSRDAIISPAWSPDGSKLAYVSFERKKAIVYVQSLVTGSRYVLANFKGSNSAPVWSPDGKRLALVLTKDGTSQIYLVNVDGSGLTRLTNSAAIDTEPNFSPDGKWLLFTSDRGGSPQVYRISVDGGEAQRLTFEGNYNVTPRFSPDGKSFVFIQRSNGNFNVVLQDLSTQQAQPLTENGFDESPTFSPNGKMILYATEINGRGILSAVSSDGRVKQRLAMQSGDVREPAWGPLLKTQ
ncbi:MAG: Tol-Pal system beta propeller repeat protein TolB [Pseudomonadota bacterium]